MCCYESIYIFCIGNLSSNLCSNNETVRTDITAGPATARIKGVKTEVVRYIEILWYRSLETFCQHCTGFEAVMR